MSKFISSTQNPLIKNLLQLQEKSRTRRKEKRFVVEGLREIFLALEADYHLEQIIYCAELISEEELELISRKAGELTEVSAQVYKRIAYRTGTEGVLAIGRQKEHGLKNISFKRENPFILVAEAPEKPGNIGALLRTADAADADAVIIANPLTDIYNPNIIRSSVGCVFTRQIATGTSEEIIAFLKDHKVNIYCAALQASVPYTQPNYKESTAIVVGTEADGLQSVWLENSTQNIIIPMRGKIDSMNVSVSAGILIFEVIRQRLNQ